MPRIPRINPGKAIPKSTTFPNQMWMRIERRGANGWEQLDPDERIIARKEWPVTHHHVTSNYAYPGSNFIEVENWVPVQGPELPRILEQRRQYLRNAQDAYEADLAEERARQAYNRKAAAWNSYTELPYRQRQWIANKDAVKDYLESMYGYDRKELDRINTLDELEDYLQTRHPEDDWPIPYGIQDSEVFGSFEEFPDDLSNAPWRMW